MCRVEQGAVMWFRCFNIRCSKDLKVTNVRITHLLFNPLMVSFWGPGWQWNAWSRGEPHKVPDLLKMWVTMESSWSVLRLEGNKLLVPRAFLIVMVPKELIYIFIRDSGKWWEEKRKVGCWGAFVSEWDVDELVNYQTCSKSHYF